MKKNTRKRYETPLVRLEFIYLQDNLANSSLGDDTGESPLINDWDPDESLNSIPVQTDL